jgi:hypothetical protein
MKMTLKKTFNSSKAAFHKFFTRKMTKILAIVFVSPLSEKNS